MHTIPLDDDDLGKLVRLAFAWDLSPQEALRRVLDEAVEALPEAQLGEGA